jgi:hypothetical protein
VTTRVLITEPVNAPLEPLGTLEIDNQPEVWRNRSQGDAPRRIRLDRRPSRAAP